VGPERRRAAALHAAGQINVTGARGDEPAGQDDGLEAGAALAVDGQTGHRHGKTRAQQGQTRHVASSADRVADDHVVDRSRGDARVGQHRGQHGSEQPVGGQLRQTAVHPAEGGAAAEDDDRFAGRVSRVR